MPDQIRKNPRKQTGFTLVELLVAMVVLMVGLIAVAQLVPMSVRLNSGNRDDSTAMAFAQRELDALIEQPISSLTFSDPNGVHCPLLAVCNLGDPTQPKVPVGSPVLMINNRPQLDFGVAKVPGYSFNYTDPNDPYNLTYDVRWAVITYSNAGNPTAKRFILGALRRSNNTAFLPLTLDTMVEK
ncbi:MAG TPA: prepilin-type N-terminal cleavage/methylation domain-containing protein [Candidatus Acidoferrum sp.]|nr:prepilin-type N-terminal cleavage/methylation domain-containing protein [Candidatus Acidoferrum sp.]